MLMDREKLYRIYHAILSMSLTWALILVMNHYYQLRIGVLASLLFSFLPVLVIYLFQKKNMVSYLLLAGILPVLALIFWITRTVPTTWVKQLIHWCRIYDGSEELYHSAYAHIILFAIAIISAVLFYYLTGTQLTKLLLASILAIGMIALSISKTDINKAVVAVCIFYILTILVELCGVLQSKKSGKSEKREGILYLAPVCLMLSLLAVLLPSKPEPIQWKTFKNALHNVREQIEIWKTDFNYYFGDSKSEFFVSLTGYSEENGELQKEGNIIQDNKIALKFSGISKDKSVYLSGSISNIYTGSSWKKNRKDYLANSQEYRLDYAELFYALARQDYKIVSESNLIKQSSLKVIYHNIKTKTFFYPLKMSGFSMLSDYKKLTKEAAQINFKKAQKRGTAYQLDFYEMNLDSEVFQQILRNDDLFTYKNDRGSINLETAEYLRDTVFHDNELDYMIQKQGYYEELKNRAEMIQEQYTGLPDTLPKRVYELAMNITKDLNTDYDKLKAIEKYLSTNYTYSLEARQVPEGQDFIDYFLFDYRKGYCTSYATAMAVLGRCLGIPTRYVEGFIGKTEDMDDKGMYLIKNSQAHAWAEAYIEGVGWIPFEATAPFYGYRYTTWAEKSAQEEAKNGGYSSPYASYPGDNYNTPQQNIDNTPVLEETKTEEIVDVLLFIVLFLLIIVTLIIIYYLTLKYRYKKSFIKADDSKKTYMLFLRILHLLKREGFCLQQQETILMLSERINKVYCYEQVTFSEVADIFMRYRYAEEKMTKQDFYYVNLFHQGIAKQVLEQESRMKAWLEEFLFLAGRNKY